MSHDNQRWQPQTVLRYVRTVRSSSRTAFVQTDAGGAYLKAVNNPEGPHVLACDWFGTHLARRFGLPTFDVAVVWAVLGLMINCSNGRRVMLRICYCVVNPLVWLEEITTP